MSLSADGSKTIELEGSGTGLITEILLSLVRSEWIEIDGPGCVVQLITGVSLSLEELCFGLFCLADRTILFVFFSFG